ncbi:ABC transporter ATP-binding protein [Candidatus Giovannonibacteria bacterium]|nr:ABC transporter ATP-binding protein [Candidatus Giovannonibacteria bacterium]
MPLISARGLEKVYEEGETRTPALGGVSFEIDSGDFVAIMGPSGSGKSTLLHILGFLDRESAGEYRFDGKTIRDVGEDELAGIRNKKMGFIFQAFNLLPRATVWENVRLPLTYSRTPESEWDELTEKAVAAVGLAPRKNHESSQLSGGERQRVAIARALVLGPEVIFADEPTGNLDSKSGRVVMEIIQRLNEEEGRTVILITHETYTAEHARRIIQLLDGKIASDTRVEHRHRAREDFKK